MTSSIKLVFEKGRHPQDMKVNSQIFVVLLQLVAKWSNYWLFILREDSEVNGG